MHFRVVFLLVVAFSVFAASCSSEPTADTEHDHAAHEHPETNQLPGSDDAQQAYAVVDGRAGYRRMPLIDVSATELVEYSETEAGRAFVPVADPGEILLLFFGYLSCPDVCPTTLFDYGEALDLVPDDVARRVSFGMISIDAERDEGPQVVVYVGRFIDDGLGLIPANEDGLDAAASTFGVRYEIEDHEEGSTKYLVGHTATVFAIDEDGMIVWEFSYPTPAEDLASALIDLLEERY